MTFFKWRLIEKPYGYEWELTTLWRRIKARRFGLEQDNIIWMKGGKMSTEHTPGPWHYSKSSESVNQTNGEGGRLADVLIPEDVFAGFAYAEREPTHANGRLMAAGPDMLDAIRSAKELLEQEGYTSHQYEAVMAQLNDALDKALEL